MVTDLATATDWATAMAKDSASALESALALDHQVVVRKHRHPFHQRHLRSTCRRTYAQTPGADRFADCRSVLLRCPCLSRDYPPATRSCALFHRYLSDPTDRVSHRGAHRS